MRKKLAVTGSDGRLLVVHCAEPRHPFRHRTRCARFPDLPVRHQAVALRDTDRIGSIHSSGTKAWISMALAVGSANSRSSAPKIATTWSLAYSRPRGRGGS
ncbi:hypothetical protein AB0O75_48590 [Streptomyces sp. NPDC088921]|uniref:hypothetical protein n=1 Tax=unclassified Streptomyces TaxID=2593676 RepID=UPI0034207FA7